MCSTSVYRSIGMGLAIVVCAFVDLGAQMPGTPVLQYAFANPGITAAADIATSGAKSSYALAGAWAPGSARFQLSGGVGVQTRSGSPARAVYGARVNVPVYGAGGRFGASAFAGYGGLGGAGLDSSDAKTLIPLGATVSYRLGTGMVRGFSVYGSPVFEWIGRGGSGGSASAFRGSIGVDIGVTAAIGLTLGLELGPKQEEGSAKPSGTAFGAAVSYALGGRS